MNAQALQGEQITSYWTPFAEARFAAATQVREAARAEQARHEHCGTFHHGSCAADDYMRREIARLQAEVARLQAEAEHWYMKANHTDIELATFARRRSLGQDEATGAWLTIDQQEATRTAA